MKTKEDLIEIFNDTKLILALGGYKDSLGNWHPLETDHRGQRFYQTLKPIKKGFNSFKSLKVYTQKIDPLQKARHMGSSCAVLNMASFIKPGGDVSEGVKGQEEDLCRRSTLYTSLISLKSKYRIPMFGGIYSPDIQIFKSTSYNVLRNPYKCSIISVPGILKPEVDQDTGLMSKKDERNLKGKVRAILRISCIHHHTKLILGALGCGNYQNPPLHVAKIFKEVLGEKEFDGKFKEICFAVKEDKIKKEFEKVFPSKPY
jgi:uncharacterized protein (TIGR02452 family)